MTTYIAERIVGLVLIWCALATFLCVGMYRLGRRNGQQPTPPRDGDGGGGAW